MGPARRRSRRRRHHRLCAVAARRRRLCRAAGNRQQVEQGKEAAVVESVKAASEVYAPVSGEVAEVNDRLAADPAKVNADPMGEGWFFKLRLGDPKELDGLMDEAAYKRFVEEQH